jgi:hypothetical protein
MQPLGESMPLTTARAGMARRPSLVLSFLTLGLIAVVPFAGRVLGGPDTWLLRVPTADEAAIARLADEGGRPVRLGPGYALVLATPDEERLPALQALGCERLGAWRADRLYYLVYLPATAPGAVPAAELGKVLYRDVASAVVEVSPGGEDSLTIAYRCVRIFPRTLRLGAGMARAAVEEGSLRTITHDPQIQAMVDAVGIPTMTAKVNDLVAFGTRKSTTTGGVQAQNYLVAQLQALGYSQVSTFDYNTYCDNVIAVKPGVATPGRIYIIGGHYDSISNVTSAPGADDNASGTAGVLEAARVLAPYSFESTIYFIGWSGEEQGLVGSDAWCTWAVQQGLDIRGYINLDMEGYLSLPRDLDVLSNTSSQWLRNLVFELVPLYVPTLSLIDGFLTAGSSDHASFWDHGYAALFFFEDSDNYSPYIHTVNDVVGTSLNNFQFMKENVQAAVATIATLAAPFTLAIDHTPLEDTPNTATPYPVTARIIAVSPLVTDSLRVFYQTGGAFVPVRLDPTGNPDEYRGEIPPQPAGTLVQYYLRARDEAGHVKTDPAAAPGQLYAFMTGIQVVFADDFETDRGWTVGAAGDGATTGIWLRADPVGTAYQTEDDHTPDPGHLCFVTGNGAVGGGAGDQDVDGGRTSLLSPVIDLSGATWVRLTYERWFVDATNVDDNFWVYLSNDGGTSWTVLERLQSSATPWTTATFPDLGQVLPLTSQMRLKFAAEDIGSGSLVEAALDDLALTAVYTSPVAAPEATPGAVPAAVRLLPARPNPAAAGSTTLTFSQPAAGAVSLSLFDVGGRLVRTLVRDERPAGIQSVAWDGRDAAGRPAAAGVYLVRLEASGRVERGRVTLVR